MKNIRVWFSSGRLGTAAVTASLALLIAPAANAQQFSGTFSGPNETVRFSANGPTAVLNMPQVQVSNFNQEAAFQAAQQAAQAQAFAQGIGTNGSAGSEGNFSYKTGEAPEDAGESANHTNPTLKLNPRQGPGSNVGLTPMTNGLMAPFTVSNQPIPQFDGMGYGFNSNPQHQIYDMSYGTGRLINGLINGLGGGFITTGPALPVTSTGSVNLNTTLGNGY